MNSKEYNKILRRHRKINKPINIKSIISIIIFICLIVLLFKMFTDNLNNPEQTTMKIFIKYYKEYILLFFASIINSVIWIKDSRKV